VTVARRRDGPAASPFRQSPVKSKAGRRNGAGFKAALTTAETAPPTAFHPSHCANGGQFSQRIDAALLTEHSFLIRFLDRV
jgi:hypothetical protein